VYEASEKRYDSMQYRPLGTERDSIAGGVAGLFGTNFGGVDNFENSRGDAAASVRSSGSRIFDLAK